MYVVISSLQLSEGSVQKAAIQNTIFELLVSFLINILRFVSASYIHTQLGATENVV